MVHCPSSEPAVWLAADTQLAQARAVANPITAAERDTRNTFPPPSSTQRKCPTKRPCRSRAPEGCRGCEPSCGQCAGDTMTCGEHPPASADQFLVAAAA